MIKTLTLSIDEICQLIEIADPDQRQQVLQSLTDNAATPPTEITPDDYADSHPLALRIAEKIRRKAQDAARRRSRKQKRQSQPTVDEPQPASDRKPNKPENIVIELNEATVGRLLWLKQNHKLWRKAINCTIEAISGSSIPRQLRAQIQHLLSQLFGYLDPLIRQANNYHRTPRRFRPRFASI